MAQKWPGVKQPELPPEQLQPLRGPAAQGSSASQQGWTTKYNDRGPTVAKAQKELEDTINKLPKSEQAKWNEVAEKQLAIKLNSSRDKTPLPAEEVDLRLSKQMLAVKRLIEMGEPTTIYNRIGEPTKAANMKPVITATGHAKWVNENGRVFSYQRIPGTKEKGWVQAKPSGEDTQRRIEDMRSIVNSRRENWALASKENFSKQRVQRGNVSDDRVYTTDKVTGERRKKTVDEVVEEIGGKNGRIPQKYLRNGLDQTGNEGKELNPYYDKNPLELDTRYREGIKAWIDQAGLSLATGKPIALPGMEPKAGEERSSIDHFTPISTYRNQGLSGAELRKVVDNGKNFNIVEESFNSQRSNTPWLTWADRVLAPPPPPKTPRRQKESTAVNEKTPRATRKKEDTNYNNWEERARGNYGKVSVSPDGTRAVKQLLVGDDGKKGEFGEFEIQLAKRMGEMGHSPRVYKTSKDSMEMDAVKGAPLWKDYKRGENEPVMNAAQATKAAAAIRDLHKLGYAHGDNHALQYLVDGNNVKLVDYGLSVPVSRQPTRVMQDLSKISNLVRWDNPELAGNPYVQVVNRHLPAYRAVKGTSKAAKAEKERIAQAYLQDLESLE
jgi:tRNA A-37 threonylcarbamoyl transferase component Bud32